MKRYSVSNFPTALKHNLTLLFTTAILLCTGLGCTSCSDYTTEETNPEIVAVKGLVHRIIPEKERSFVFELLPAEDKDYFRLESRGNRIAIGGNNANSMAVGLNYYLKYYCLVEVGWFKSDGFKMPRRLPKVDSPVRIEARVDKRFFFNYCTYGYTMPWWGWEEWEHVIDWMALNGVNLPLAITGQEAIWYRIWTEMGLSDEEVRNYFTGPAHLPWHRMQNIDRWGGPLPKSWLEGQMELQKKITERERQFNMKPVLPAFAGHVPRELKRIHPEATITQHVLWGGFPEENVCYFLDPMSVLYTEIQKKFVEKESEIYGTDHIYGIDIFNEMTPPSPEPEYLGRVSRQVYESLAKADPQAIWLQMGWLFYNERYYWLNDRVKAYLTSFPKEKQLILDYYCEQQEVWQRTEQFFGVPYIWCYLGNFGGNTALAGDLKEIDRRIENTFVSGGDSFNGIGSTLEGFDCNPFVYEYVLEKAWDMPQHRNMDQWTQCLADQRIGTIDVNGRAAWKLLVDSIYLAPAVSWQKALVNARPSFGQHPVTYYANTRFKYDNAKLREVLRLLLEADGRNTAYSFDVANITRQWLSNRFQQVFGLYEDAYGSRDREKMRSLAGEMTEMLDDIDEIVSTQSAFLVGKWIADARKWGTTPQEADYFESNARNLITTWSDSAMVLNDYAARSWGGMVKTYCKPRWTMFFEAIDRALDEGSEFDENQFSQYYNAVTAYEKRWWHERLYDFPSSPVGDAKEIAKRLLEKYSESSVNSGV